MPSDLISLTENVGRQVGAKAISIYHNMYAVPARYYEKGEYKTDGSEEARLDEVYGVFSGQPEPTDVPVDYETIEVLLFGDLYFIYHQSSVDLGMFADYKCYTKEDVILKPQSLLQLVREDGRELNFRVEDRMAQGILLSIMPLWKLTYLEG